MPSPADAAATHLALSGKRAALVVAHPGHELRVHGWLSSAMPVTAVLTDGSSWAGVPRIDATTALLRDVGARPAALYAPLTDRATYDALLAGEVDLFVRLATALADLFLSERIDYVVGDAAEGYHPVHDACRILIDVATEHASRVGGRLLPSYGFALDGPPDAGSPALAFRLDDDAFARKLAAARAYDALAGEIGRALDLWGAEAFRTEHLLTVPSGATAADDPPFYERYGELRVAAGDYDRVIRRREHVLPLATALRRRLADAA